METRTFLSLPVEIQHLVYDHIYAPWSLAVFDAADTHRREETMVNVVNRNNLALSWPPGSNLLLVCHAVHDSVRDRYGSHFTGILYFGRTRHADVTIQELPLGFRRWFEHVHTLHSPCLQSMRVLKGIPYHRFPRLRSFTGVVRDWQALECVRDGGIRAFLGGNMDGRVVHYSRMGDVRGLYRTASMKEHSPGAGESPQDFVLDLTLLAVNTAETSGWRVASVRIRQECNEVTIIGRTAISDRQLHCWTVSDDLRISPSQSVRVCRSRDTTDAEEWRRTVGLTDFDLTML